MKKIFIVFILFLCLISTKEIKGQSYLGVKGGANIPFVNFTDFTNRPISTRFPTAYFVSQTFGISYRYMQNDKIGIQLDLNYSTKGWGQNTLDSTNTFYTNTVITEINYLEMPFYLHWEVFGKEKFKFFVDAGVYVAWALNSSTTIENDQDLDQVQIYYSPDRDNRGDFGINAGVGFSYDFSLFILQLDGSFKSGFANILPVNHFIRENPTTSTNQVTAIQLSLLFPLSKESK
ncbi:porin family protein [Marivirga salinae]|uniref:Porin family protein n=1 Tax=Marivirga salinarum TaxID=3059078 RepID=A0AA49J9U4_9BACT|nr:porin family protein [Marivirga sp. BDSF4-3]WKK78430.2 porin family protein [Marivirga sp. BDSF4-3]